MTGQSGGPVRLHLRAPPHLPFVQGWPGILAGANRNGAGVHGTVEVRVGVQPVKAKYVHIKVVKYEATPSNSVTKGAGQTSTTYIGKVHVLWKAPDNKEWDTLQTADFRFIIPLPADLPPSAEGKSGGAIRYELVATVCYKSKSGLFKKDQSSLTSASEPLRIIKHELASAWPAYNNLERRSVQTPNGQAILTVERPTSAFGPGDRMNVTAILRSQAPPVFRLKEFDMALVEILTVFPPAPDKNSHKSKKNKEPQGPVVKRTAVGTTRAVVNDTVAPGMERSARLDLVIPSDRQLLTVAHATLFSVHYELVVEATCEGLPSKVLISDLPCILGSFTRSSAQQVVRDIGYVEGLCPRPAAGTGHQATASLPGHTQDSPQGSLRGHQSSASFSTSGLRVPDSYNRPLSMTPAVDPRNRPLSLAPSADPQFSPSSQQYSPPPQHTPPPQVKRPPSSGFAPQELWRRSSSGTTTTTTTTTTAQTDYGPIPDRNASTLPTRSSLAFPMPSPGLSLNTRGSESPIIPQREVETQRDERADTNLGNPHRLSTATSGTFGPFGIRPATAQSHSTEAAPSPSSPIRGREHWPSAEEEKQRLRYDAARASAAKSQAAHGANLKDLGLVGVPLGAPPDYFPSSGSQTPRHSTPPLSASQVKAVQASTPRASPSPVSRNEYKSAAEEKDEMRRRYEMAQNRVVSATGGSPSHNSSPSMSSRHHADDSRSSFERPTGSMNPVAQPAAYMSAADEKEQMRRFEDAKNQVARRAMAPANGSPTGSASGHGQSRSISQTYPSAAEEKDMMRRKYEEAHRRVVSSSNGRPDPSGPPVSSPGNPAQPTHYPSAAEEKELMRRKYEQAQQRVVSSSSAGPPPATYPSAAEEKEMMRRKYEAAQQRVVSSSSAGPPPSTYPSAAEEKEMMRQKFENAQSRVNANGNDEMSSGRGSGSASQSQAYMSAEQEKEQMRRRYEQAQSRVVSGSMGQGSSSGMAHTPPPTRPTEDPIPYDELFGTASGSGSGHGSTSFGGPGPSSTSHASAVPAAYMSAEEEKAAMKRRFEEAQQRVAQQSGMSPPSSPPPFGTAGEPSSASGFMTAKEEKEAERLRYEAAQSAVDRAGGSGASLYSPTTGGMGDGGYRSRLSAAPLPAGPPPPLPGRPPAEYITRI